MESGFAASKRPRFGNQKCDLRWQLQPSWLLLRAQTMCNPAFFLTWDVTVTDTVVASCLNATSNTAGSAAKAAASQKEKYAATSSNNLFFPLAFETFRPINKAGCDFLFLLGSRLSLVSDDPRENLHYSYNVCLFLFSASTLSVFAIEDLGAKTC